MATSESFHNYDQHSGNTSSSHSSCGGSQDSSLFLPARKIENPITDLDDGVSQHFRASPLKGINTEDVFSFLTNAVSQSYVTGIKELIKIAHVHGYFADIQFFRCEDRKKVAPVAITFVKNAPDGSLVYGLPNVTAILDKPEERLRGDSGTNHKKLTRAVDGTASEGEDATFGGSVFFEDLKNPARVLLSESTDQNLHRPYDLSVQLSISAKQEATSHLVNAYSGATTFSFLKECVIEPAITEALSRLSIHFGLRERAEIISFKQHDSVTFSVLVDDPRARGNESAGEALPLQIALTDTPFVDCIIELSV